MEINETYLELVCGFLQKSSRVLDMIVAATVAAILIDRTKVDVLFLGGSDMILLGVSYVFDSLVKLIRKRTEKGGAK